MKYLKKFESKFVTYDSMETEDLEEMLHWSRIEYTELYEKISSISKELTKRKENSEVDHSKSFPESIFDLNKEQLDWVFEHHHGTTSKRYSLSGAYIRQLTGFTTVGFNAITNQYQFSLNGYYLEDGDLTPIIKNLKFLGDNLKKHRYSIGRAPHSISIESVKFQITYSHKESYDDSFHYVNDDEIYYTSFLSTAKKFDDINKLIEYIKMSDVDANENDY